MLVASLVAYARHYGVVSFRSVSVVTLETAKSNVPAEHGIATESYPLPKERHMGSDKTKSQQMVTLGHDWLRVIVVS